jgi:hypothetical protein
MNTARTAAVVAVVAALAGCGNDSAPGAVGGTMLPSAFPLTSVLVAAEQSLPTQVEIGEIPMDTRWLPGNRIEVPIQRDGATGLLTVVVLPDDRACAAESSLLSVAEADSVAAQVCTTWESEGRLPVVVPDPDAPIELDPSDAAR